MATAEQIKSLIRSHVDKDEDRFKTIALQLAAAEAKNGHQNIAIDIRKIIEVEDQKKKLQTMFSGNPFASSELFVTDMDSKHSLNELVVSKILLNQINRILLEYRQQHKLHKHGLSARRKALLVGPPGTGKTLTASVVSKELGLPLYVIQVDKMVTKFMGETSAKLRQIFDQIATVQGVYLFDEFDAIASERTMENDVGEMRRVINAFLQFIEQDQSQSIIIAATNNPKMLDKALFRRFDDVLYFTNPTAQEIKILIKNRLGTYMQKSMSIASLNKITGTLSHADLVKACENSIKNAILNSKNKVSVALLSEMLNERNSIYDFKDEK